MATTTKSSDVLQMELKTKQICRFCLIQQQEKLGSIYQRDSRLKSSAPLPVQVMACASIEVFSNDGMPSWVCSDCRLLFEHAYRFKQMCKRAEMLLRQFPLTGQWPNPLAKPKFPKELLPPTTQQGKPETANKPMLSAKDKTKKSPEFPRPKKLLNVDPAESPEPPIPTRLKKEKLDQETTNFLNKVENNEELSIDDVHRLIAASEEDEEVEFLECESVASEPQIQTKTPKKAKPKLLNKSSIRILNKDAEIVLEPRLSAPKLKRDVDGNMAIVTAILDPQTSYEPEPDADTVKDVTPVETVVFACPHCERSFPLRQLRDIHMVNHSRSRSFQCPECDKSFFSKYDLQKHTLIHTGDRPFKCTVCDKSFTRATLLHRHEKTHTDIPKFICIYCEKPFISKDQMEKHTERHIKNRPYKCSLCKKSFAFKQGLERHEVIHSSEQPYPCQYCDQSFSTPSKLARHLTAHAGKRPYPCKFCPKSYLLSHHLTRHLRSHKYGTVAFMCSDCDKVFKSRDELIYHSAVHATQTLVCPLCKETFQDIQSVTLHIKEHADGEAFACEFCDLIFMTADRLQQHTDADHAGDMIAYHEDDEQKQRLQLEEVKKSESDEKEDSKNSENLRLLEETIEEFLVDDLPGETETLTEAKVVSVEDIKEESEWTNQSSDQPHILNQIVFHSKSKSNDDDDILVLDENIVEANEAVDEDDAPLRQPPSKVRKIINQRTRQIAKSVEPQTTSKQQKNISPQTRRKAAEAAQQASTQEIKIEKETIVEKNSPKSGSNPNMSQTSINSYLKMLPKGVSVRRNNPSNTENNTSNEKPSLKTSPTQGQQKETRSSGRSSHEGSATMAVKKIQSANETSTKNKEQPMKRSTNAAELNKSGSSSGKFPGTSKTMKMMIGDKKVKVQKITLTKAEAAAMTKDGRIRMKDGNMILTKVPK